ncbi:MULTISPECIES: hypothetical protein [Sphingomonas]|uniref:Uncharacterized protein n=1 Tax=Sphingomonas molluscorum TaxID=418184 RepID=A0ABU8Q7M7_9SPHN|nr:hypothetical protein [Sphingomonas sp. JUb134]MBM7407046.1 hypothetical protein [Sphingomonas sp. JUb134]
MDATTLVLIGTALQFTVSAAPIARGLRRSLRTRTAPIALAPFAIATSPRI